jgi:phage terminase large subunit-like protein
MSPTTQSKTSVTASQTSGLLPKKDWAPTFYTKRKYKVTDGDDVIDFADDFLRVSKGVRAGESLEFVEWQRWLLRALLERRDNNKLRYRRALIGLPRKQGKSLMGSALGLYGLFAGEAGAEVYSAAGDRKQARIVFNEAKEQVIKSPVLSSYCKVYRDAIEVPAYNSVYRVLSADAKSQAGLNPSLVIFDELWVQRNEDLYDQLTLGSGARIDPLVVAITTAGYDIDTLCGRLYDYGKSVASGETDDENFGFFWWEAPADCSITDPKVWSGCNPNLAQGLLDPEDLATSAQQSSEMSFRRFRLNQWVRAEESWLPAGAWERLVGETEMDTELGTWVGIDMALKHDSIAVVMAQPQEGKVAVTAKIWHPSEKAVDVAEIEHYLRELHLNYNIKEFAYDPAYFQRSAEILIDDGLPMLEYPQSSQRMVPACGHIYEMIINNKIVHNGSPVFTDQVLSAAQRMTDQGWRLSKGKSRRKIDACIAMVIAVDRATRRQDGYDGPSIVDVW